MKSSLVCDKKVTTIAQDDGSVAEGFEEATTNRQSPHKTLSYLMDESVFISTDLYEFLLSSLPNIVKGCQWMLLYRSVLLKTLYT